MFPSLSGLLHSVFHLGRAKWRATNPWADIFLAWGNRATRTLSWHDRSAPMNECILDEPGTSR